MKYYIICILFLSMLVFNQSCKTTKTPKIEKETQVNTNNKISAGYKKGILKMTRLRSCPYTMTVDSYSDSLDPVNIEDFFKFFKFDEGIERLAFDQHTGISNDMPENSNTSYLSSFATECLPYNINRHDPG